MIGKDCVEVPERKDYGSRTDVSHFPAVTIIKKPEVQSPVIATIVIPAYNEREGLPVVLSRLLKAVDSCCEVLVVDDGSTDGTCEAASAFQCGIIRHNENQGKGEAMRTGIRYASGESVIFIDADATYPPEAIPKMLEALKTYDLVYCSRAYGRHNIPWLNRVGGVLLQGLIKGIYGFEGRDYSTGLYGIRKRHLESMSIISRGFAVEPEIAIKASRMKLKIHDIPIEYQPRRGRAKLCSYKAGWEHLKIILRLVRWQEPYREESR